MKNDTLVTTAERSLKSILKAINDFYVVEEDPIETSYETGTTPEVTEAVKSGKLFIPEAYSAFIQKFPCRGKVISRGNKCKQDIQIGDRVMYARLGCQRFEEDDKSFCVMREKDIHAILT